MPILMESSLNPSKLLTITQKIQEEKELLQDKQNQLKNIKNYLTNLEYIKMQELDELESYIQNQLKKFKKIYASEKPFNTVDNKRYVVIWRGDSGNNWRVVKFQNKNEQRYHKFDDQEKYYIQLGEYNYQGNFDISINQHPSSVWTLKPWQTDNGVYFKSVYRWDDVGNPNIKGKNVYFFDLIK